MELDTIGIAVGVAGGLSLFLYGLSQMTDSLQMAAGTGLRTALAKLTANRFAGVLSGVFVTTLTQSSSVTTVLLVGFVSAGLMTLPQSVGVIMGANIGSTVTAQIIAFDVSKYALAVVSIGFLCSLAKNKKFSRYGVMVMGLGMVFYGMGLMSDSTLPLRSFPPFIELMKRMESPVYGILVGAGFTALVQSSAATTGILIVLASQGTISLEAGIIMAFGANIGTCATALLASLGKPREALQVAAVHILFNTLGVLFWLPLVGYLSDIVRDLSPAFPALPVDQRLARETPRQLANAHTLFNVANTALLIAFTGPIARLVGWLIPAPPRIEPEPIRPKFIDPVYLQTPDLALERIRHELGRVGRRVVDMMEAAPLIVIEGEPARIRRVSEMGREVQGLYTLIVEYARRLGGMELSEAQSHDLQRLLAVGNHLASVADLIETNFMLLVEEAHSYGLKMSPGTQERMRRLYQAVSQAMTQALAALAEGDPGKAQEVVESKPEIEALANETIERLSQRLLADEPNRVILFRIQNEAVNQIKRLFYFAKKIARVTLEESHRPAMDSTAQSRPRSS